MAKLASLRKTVRQSSCQGIIFLCVQGNYWGNQKMTALKYQLQPTIFLKNSLQFTQKHLLNSF